MTLYNFNILSFTEKQAVLWEHGTFPDNVIQNHIHINCYAIHMFFVEVHYDPTSNTIVDIKSFKCGETLDKYSKFNQ